MSTFEYRGFDGLGQVRTGLIEAVDSKEARERLWRAGILAERMVPVVGATADSHQPPFSRSQRAAIYHELAALLLSGLPLARALELLIESPDIGAGRLRLAMVKDRVAEGQPLYRVLAEIMSDVPAYEVAVLETAERTGSLGHALENLALFLDEQDQVRAKIGNALIYPSIVAVAAILIGGGTLGLLVPRIGAVLKESQIPQPAITRWVIAMGRVVPWLVGLLTALTAASWFWIRTRPEARSSWRRVWETMLSRLPFVSTARDLLAGSRFCRTLALLLRGGVPLVEALPLAGRATGRADLSAAAVGLADRVRHGASLADAIRAVPAFVERIPGWIQAGETSGQLESMLESAALQLQNQWERQTARWMALLEPSLTLLVSLFVLVIALAVLLPVLSMTRAL